MIRDLWHWMVGRWCEAHQVRYRSHFCGQCITAQQIREQTRDKRPEWLRADGSWPVRR